MTVDVSNAIGKFSSPDGRGSKSKGKHIWRQLSGLLKTFPRLTLTFPYLEYPDFQKRAKVHLILD